jgi:hypothetical protein
MDRELLAELYGGVLVTAAVGAVLLACAWAVRQFVPGGLPAVGPTLGMAGVALVGAGVTAIVLFGRSRTE